MNDIRCFVVSIAGTQERLDRIITEWMFKEHGALALSRSQIQRLITSGKVAVNGVAVSKGSLQVKNGDTVAIVGELKTESGLEGDALDLEIMFEDQYLIVVNKPAGIAMHPGAGLKRGTLANALVAHIGEAQADVGVQDRPGIVHRLDKDTTGIVVVAKSTPVLAALSKQFSDRTVKRTYRALVYLTPRSKSVVRNAEEGIVQAAIGRHPTNRVKMAIRDSGGRAATTTWRVAERMLHGAVLELKLGTGRTHQIRVHMDSVGAPIVGDTVYGDWSGLPNQLRKAAERFGRQALHAETLGFIHPITGAALEFAAPVPKDFEGLIAAFREN